MRTIYANGRIFTAPALATDLLQILSRFPIGGTAGLWCHARRSRSR